jgi:predicted DNA-binding transcriptional regulator AlpA
MGRKIAENAPPVYVGFTEVCRMLGRSRRTLQRWIRDKIFPAPVMVGPHTARWRLAAVVEHLRRLEDQRGDPDREQGAAAPKRRLVREALRI